MKKLLIIFTLVFISCTSNNRARNFGGTEEIKLKPNEKLIGITWKETAIWLHTKDTLTNIDYFREKSSWGYMEGTLIIK